MDDLARFAPCNFRGGARLKNGSQGCVDPTWRGHRAIIPTQQVCFFCVWISCCIFKRERGSKLSDDENDAKFRTF